MPDAVLRLQAQGMITGPGDDHRRRGRLICPLIAVTPVAEFLDKSWVGRRPIEFGSVVNRTILARTHVIPALGVRKLAQLSAEEVDQWLAAKAKTLSTDTLHLSLIHI